MNKAILNNEIQEYIENNINSSITDLILKGTNFNNIKTTEIVEQIEAKKRSKKKLPTWFHTKNIYFPNKLNIEQTSSETTAVYKASLVSGERLIDLTGGFGVDSFYFSKKIKNVIHCEINRTLSELVSYNYKQLEVDNINCIAKNGIQVLNEIQYSLSWIFIDPSRRDDIKGKVFLLKDCIPNVPEHLSILFKHTDNVMIKTSPLLDISSTINELKYVKNLHVVAVNNEVKELLWILKHNYTKDIEIKTLNIKKGTKDCFNFSLKKEAEAKENYSEPLSYLYEPNAAILKAGAFKYLAEKLNLKKLHKHSHLYTSNKLVKFPGRCFTIKVVTHYNKKIFKREFKEKKANITTRNFPYSVNQIRSKLSLKDGGEDYLFFTTDIDNNKIIIVTKKAKV